MGRRRVSKRFKFMFVGPKVNANADELAEKLVSMDNVEEVFVTDGDYGFLVKVRLGDEPDGKKLLGYIKRNVAEKFGTATSYYSIKR